MKSKVLPGKIKKSTRAILNNIKTKRNVLEMRANPRFKKIQLFLLNINFFYVLNSFDALIFKILFFLKKKTLFNTFQNKNYFKKQL
jgi:hypothetical protein